MLHGKPSIIFDTSGLNGLTDDAEARAIIPSLNIAFSVRLTETNVSEIGATPDPERRDQLIGTCKRLVSAGECIKPYNWIVENLAQQYQHNPANFDWRRISLRSREIEYELARQEILDDAMALEIRKDFEARQAEFAAIYAGARAAFDDILEKDGATRPQISTLIEILKRDGGAFWNLAAGIYERPTGVQLDEAGIRAFVDACPPFHALMLGLCVAQFHGCVRHVRDRALYKAGRLDLFMATYLPYCDQFITKDPGQYNSLSVVATEANLPTQVRSYSDFRQGLLIHA